MHVAIRADGGSGIGYGHLVRSRALTEALLTRGHEVTVATTTPDPAQSIFPDSVESVSLPSRSDPEPFVEWLDTTPPDLVFTDSYPVDTAYQQVIRERVPLAVLQDDTRHAVCADLLLNGNLYATDLDYTFRGSPPELCLGSEYVLLRNEIRQLITGEEPFAPTPESLILTMGGNDVQNSTPMILDAIEESDYTGHVTVVIGPGYDNVAAIRNTATSLSQSVECVRDPADLPMRMCNADIAITSTGTTVYELLGLQTPFIGIPQVTNQKIIADVLETRKLAAVLPEGVQRERIVVALNEFVADIDFRRQIHQRCPIVVDGRGVLRVADQISQLGMD
jgi:UDP-2,4-diacetamido-2,4,6-trideoxy-beta-L-altropyranose hydrolase